MWGERGKLGFVGGVGVFLYISRGSPDARHGGKDGHGGGDGRHAQASASSLYYTEEGEKGWWWAWAAHCSTRPIVHGGLPLLFIFLLYFLSSNFLYRFVF